MVFASRFALEWGGHYIPRTNYVTSVWILPTVLHFQLNTTRLHTLNARSVSRVAVRISIVYNFESRSFSVSVQAQQTKRNISRKILRKVSIPNMLMLWLTNTYYTHLLPQREYFVKIYIQFGLLVAPENCMLCMVT